MPLTNKKQFERDWNSLENSENNAESTHLQQQLGDMEGEVKKIQIALAAIKHDRVRKPKKRSNSPVPEVADEMENIVLPEDSAKVSEQYLKLKEELYNAKKTAENEKAQREKYALKLKELENTLNKLCSSEAITGKKNYSTGETESLLKMEIRNLKEEMEELNQTLVEKTEQCQEYRLKYLQAQQHVEESKRQLEVIDYDSKQVSDQIQIEIQKMKVHFQEKLHDLAPLPDLLKATQLQLQEASQLQRLAEENSQQVTGELNRVKEKLVIVVNTLNQEKALKSQLHERNKILKDTLDNKTIEIENMQKSLDEYRLNITRLEEKCIHQEALMKEKINENTKLSQDFEELRSESSRSLARSKERADSMRRYLQMQISELERQLIQSRAQSKTCQKERDDIRQRLQLQINSLQENFEMVEMRLRNIQAQLVTLKKSYSTVMGGDDDIEGTKMVIS